MNTPAPVLNLHDIALPMPISWWPPAPGWWLLAIISILGIASSIYYYFKNRYRRTALKELHHIQRTAPEKCDTRQWLSQLNQLLHRYARVRFPMENTAHLSGQDWLRWLDQQQGKRHDFENGAGALLGQGPYQPLPTQALDRRALIKLVKNWIQQV